MPDGDDRASSAVDTARSASASPRIDPCDPCRHVFDPGITVGFEQGLGIGGIGLVAATIRAHMLGWQQANLQSEPLALTPPVMRGGARFHHHDDIAPLPELQCEGAAAGNPLP